LLGMGWGIDGLSQITRCPTTLIQDGVINGVNFTNTDRFCIDGQRLIATTDTYNATTKIYTTTAAYGANLTEYRTEQANFAKIISYGSAGNGPAYFKVWTKAGQVIEYGNTTDSRIEAAGIATARSWGVNKISDTKGNYITVSYTEDNPNGEAYVSRIDYTGNATSSPALTPYANVQFTYETRPDPSTGYHAGSVMKSTKRMTNIKTYMNTTLVKDYRLTYEQGTATQRSRLKTLTECDGNTATPACLQAVNMSVTDSLAGFSTPLLWVNSYGVTSGGWAVGHHPRMMADVNGDGKDDVVGFSGAGVLVSLSTATGFTTPAMWVNAYGETSGGWSESYHPRMMADVNGDGKADVIGFSSAGVLVSLSTGTGFTAPAMWVNSYGVTSGGWAVGHHPRMMADVNGDGKDDVVGFSGAGVLVSLSTATGFTTPAMWVNAYGETSGGWSESYHPRMMADVNGDGKADVIGFSSAGVLVSLSTGTGFTAPAMWVNSYGVTSGGWAVGHHPRMMADVNGDGKPDVVGFSSGGVQVSTASAVPVDLLTTLTPGLGTTTSLTYKPITDNSIYVKGTTGEVGTTTCPQPLGTDGTSNSYPILNTQDAQYVVSTATVSDGNGGVLNNNYSYGGAKVHMTGRGSLGFRYQKVTSVEADTNSTTFFRQDYPYIGLPCQTEKRITSSNAVIGASALTYTNRLLSAGTATSQFPYLSQSLEQSFELGGTTPINSTTTTNQYDDFGNATQIVVNSNDGYVKTTNNVYLNNPANFSVINSTNWLLGRLLRSTVTSTTPNPAPPAPLTVP
ncbi:MAG: hypothetical protein HOO90_00005, partial [Methylotenera sp.]|uniref:FG-GAP-like repeat-containing protein n=1 Tax=Methylotenera sp. TaxID=2051956 RepID=UPI0018549C0C